MVFLKSLSLIYVNDLPKIHVISIKKKNWFYLIKNWFKGPYIKNVRRRGAGEEVVVEGFVGSRNVLGIY